MLVYDSKGKGYKVPHPVDVQEWLAAGYLKDKPSAKKRTTPKKVVSENKE